MFNKLNSENGFVLILVLMLLAAMTAIGTAALMTSYTDMLIARNEKEAKTAFYLAEAGIEEAVGRMDLSNSNGRFMGEKKTQKDDRIAGHPSFDGSANSNFNSTSLNVSGLGGAYDVTITYAREATETWCNDNPAGSGCSNSEIVLYGTNFGFSGDGVPTGNGIVPVYKVDSTGRTTSGTEAKIRVYVTPSTLNVIPPAGDIFSNTTITVGGSGSIDGTVATNNTVTGCSGSCIDFHYGGADVNMQKYLGIDLVSVPSYADSPSPYYQSGSNAVNYSPGEGAASTWGVLCSTSTTDINAHICENDAKLIYIGNQGAGDAKITAQNTGRGLLVITGDLDVAGGLTWEGAIYVMGKLKGNGTINVYGTIMANDTIDFNGNVTAKGSVAVASSVVDLLGVPKYLRWVRQ